MEAPSSRVPLSAVREACCRCASREALLTLCSHLTFSHCLSLLRLFFVGLCPQVIAGVIAAALNETPLWRGQMQSSEEKERAAPAQKAPVFGNDGKPGSQPVTEVALESEL